LDRIVDYPHRVLHACRRNESQTQALEFIKGQRIQLGLHVFIDSKKMPGADFYTIVRNAFNVKPTQAKYVDRHRHNCDTYHLFIGNETDFTGLRAEVIIDDQTSVIESPAAVYVPEGVPHCYRLIGGSGKFFNIVPKGSYNESLI